MLEQLRSKQFAALSLQELQASGIYSTLEVSLQAGSEGLIYQEARKLFRSWQNEALEPTAVNDKAPTFDAVSAPSFLPDLSSPMHCRDSARQRRAMVGRSKQQQVLQKKQGHPPIGVSASSVGGIRNLPACGFNGSQQHVTREVCTEKISPATHSLDLTQSVRQLAAISAAPAAQSAFGATFGVKSEAGILMMTTQTPCQAQGAQQELHDVLAIRLGALDKKDKLSQKAGELKSVDVQVFCCRTCQTKSFKLRADCRNKGHVIDTITQKMRFFKCKKCGNCKRLVGERLPSDGCVKCHAGPEQFAECAAHHERLAELPVDEFQPRGQEW